MYNKIALVILLIICIFSIVWAFSLRYKLDKITTNQYPLIDPARNLISQKNFLSTIEPLRKAINSYVASEKLQGSIYIEFLNTGANIHVNPDFRFWPVSLSKIPIAPATMNTIESGIWSLDHKFVIRDENQNPDISKRYPAGTEFTIHELLEKLLISSDNMAYLTLLHNLPKDSLDEMIQAVGLDQLFDKEGRINAKEYSRFFRILYTASFLNRENSEYILQLLNKSIFTDFLSKGVPEGVPFPHKYGLNIELHAFNDSGIVYIPNRPYLITVIIKGNGSADEMTYVRKVMNHISEISYAFFSQAEQD